MALVIYIYRAYSVMYIQYDQYFLLRHKQVHCFICLVVMLQYFSMPCELKKVGCLQTCDNSIHSDTLHVSERWTTIF